MTKQNAIIQNPPLPRNYPGELLVIEKGEGVYLADISGKEYLDFGSGIAVNAFGYGREDLAETAYEQMKKLIHSSNLYTTEPTIKLAKRLAATGPFSAVHFGNSGTEANESAIKYARLYSMRKKGPGNHKILCFENAFHGRTLGALSCTPNPAYQEPFKPLLPGVVVAPYNDADRLKTALDPTFCAVITEIIQGEGGLCSMTNEFADTLNSLCRQYEIMLIADEIQTGLGRTGRMYASEAVGLEPDIITLAKPLAGGLPLSATLIPEQINNRLNVGEHGSTFGGGPVVTSVALKVLDLIQEPDFLHGVRTAGRYLRKELSSLASEIAYAGEVRGEGLLLGLEIKTEKGKVSGFIKAIITACRENGLLILKSGENVLRIAPPLIIKEQEIAEGISILYKVLKGF
ncbi:MAG: aspartate aminotransferase family protein [Spirochaetota bacterium]